MKTNRLFLTLTAILLLRATACDAMLSAIKNTVVNFYATVTKLYASFPTYKDVIFHPSTKPDLITEYVKGRFNERIKMELEKAKNGGRKQPFIDSFGVYIGSDGLINTKKPINAYTSELKSENIFPKITYTNKHCYYPEKHELNFDITGKNKVVLPLMIIDHEITHALQGLNTFSESIISNMGETEDASPAVLTYIELKEKAMKENAGFNRFLVDFHCEILKRYALLEANADEQATKTSPNPALHYHLLTNPHAEQHLQKTISSRNNNDIYYYKLPKLVDLVKKHCNVYYANGQHKEDFEVVKAFEKM